MKSCQYILLSNSSPSLLTKLIFSLVCFSHIYLYGILNSFTVLNKPWTLSAKQTNQPFHGKQKSNYRGPALLHLCEVHQSLRQRSAGDGAAARSSWGGSEEPEEQLLPPSCRSLQHHWGIVQPHELTKQRRKGVIIHLWNKWVFPVLKYCRKSLMESKLRSRSYILSVMRTRAPHPNRSHCALWLSPALAKGLRGISTQF